MLITADTHFTDKTRDAYRFKLFDWLAKQQQKYKPHGTYILGDLTDSKDRHSSVLVNKTVNGICRLKPPVFIQKGNHDYIDPDNPFFKFLNHIEGIHFIVQVTETEPGVWVIPHVGTQAELEAACSQIPPNPRVVCVHGCFEGAIAETGARLGGLSLSPIEKLRPGAVWGGDIHRPQRVGRLLAYVGSPYHVRFGDDFNPRVVLLDGNKTLNLHFDAPRKWSLSIRGVEDLEQLKELRPGDQVKVEVNLTAEGASTWAETKRLILSECKRLKIEVFGCTVKLPARKAMRRQATPTHSHADLLRQFCKMEGVPAELASVGEAMVE